MKFRVNRQYNYTLEVIAEIAARGRGRKISRLTDAVAVEGRKTPLKTFPLRCPCMCNFTMATSTHDGEVKVRLRSTYKTSEKVGTIKATAEGTCLDPCRKHCPV